jgi:hypothetical protein
MVRVSLVDDTLTCRYVLRLLRAIVKTNVRNGISLHKRIIQTNLERGGRRKLDFL